MGIQNLLSFVKKACRQSNINEFNGQSIAVDVSCLLHRGLFGCASQIAQGQETDFYIRYVAKYVRMFLAINCHVILVFDGQSLPAKQDTNKIRQENRANYRRKGEQLLSEGRESEAFTCFQRCATITHEVVANTIKAFRNQEMVDIIVSPYESDAQLAYLTRSGMAYAVVTEDSDLIAFGCERLIFKIDQSGSCTVYEKENLPKCLCKSLAQDFDFTKFRRICILAGCDYLQTGLNGVGLNKAALFMSKISGTNPQQFLPRIPRYLNMCSLKIKKEFIDDFIKAENTFLYQIVFDPKERIQRPLNDYPRGTSSQSLEDDFVCLNDKNNDSTDYSYAGTIQSPSTALRLALGNPLYGPPICDEFLLPESIPTWSIWSPYYESQGKRTQGKFEVKEKRKNQCGVFMVNTEIRKVSKLGKGYSSSIKEMSHSSSSETKNGGTFSHSSVIDEDFFEGEFQSVKRRSRTIKSFFSINGSPEEARNVDSTSTSYASTNCTSVSLKRRRTNGIQYNWDCDKLLKMYETDTDISISNSAPTITEGGEKNFDDKSNEDNQKDSDPQGSVNEKVELEAINNIKSPSSVDTGQLSPSNLDFLSGPIQPANRSSLYSSYFVAKRGIKMSGLSRRSVCNPFKKVSCVRDVDKVSEAETGKAREFQDSVKFSESFEAVGEGYRGSGLRRISQINEHC
ncbi:hypothetical protein AB6A40_000068 [Gnathostoma spinigerum]|uniref:Exonuclease 1 n=1 Tax=Gnathostoma spinigerum TaxID=75299 RepID=A0ABD6E5K6_9BILA